MKFYNLSNTDLEVGVLLCCAAKSKFMKQEPMPLRK